MTATIKRKFVCVQPISGAATFRFNTEMDKLHSCYVDSEVNGTMFLTSVNGRYKFTVQKKEDSNWKIVK